MISECNTGWIGDGYCDDINNSPDCTYDGGDCCGDNINTDYCTECQCLDPNGLNNFDLLSLKLLICSIIFLDFLPI